MPLIWNTSHGKVENLQTLLINRGLAWNTDLTDTTEYTNLCANLLGDSGDITSRLRELAAGRSVIDSLLCGAIFVCRRSRFLELGGFDTRYRPFYWEDVGLGYSALRKAWKTVTVPTELALHRHSETIDKFHSQKKYGYLLINQLRFVLENSDQLTNMTMPRFWWLLRGIREAFGGSQELRKAYFNASLGRSVD